MLLPPTSSEPAGQSDGELRRLLADHGVVDSIRAAMLYESRYVAEREGPGLLPRRSALGGRIGLRTGCPDLAWNAGDVCRGLMRIFEHRTRSRVVALRSGWQIWVPPSLWRSGVAYRGLDRWLKRFMTARVRYPGEHQVRSGQVGLAINLAPSVMLQARIRARSP